MLTAAVVGGGTICTALFLNVNALKPAAAKLPNDCVVIVVINWTLGANHFATAWDNGGEMY
jgi:hypothetical protein